MVVALLPVTYIITDKEINLSNLPCQIEREKQMFWIKQSIKYFQVIRHKYIYLAGCKWISTSFIHLYIIYKLALQPNQPKGKEGEEGLHGFTPPIGWMLKPSWPEIIFRASEKAFPLWSPPTQHLQQINHQSELQVLAIVRRKRTAQCLANATKTGQFTRPWFPLRGDGWRNMWALQKLLRRGTQSTRKRYWMNLQKAKLPC